jgi:hypothetical protein
VFTKDFPENSKNYTVNDLQHEQMLVKTNSNGWLTERICKITRKW